MIKDDDIQTYIYIEIDTESVESDCRSSFESNFNNNILETNYLTSSTNTKHTTAL